MLNNPIDNIDNSIIITIAIDVGLFVDRSSVKIYFFRTIKKNKTHFHEQLKFMIIKEQCR